ncbi:hypothetical protein [Streptomyces sp. NPDC056244]|uniref:hypothetical protein n=1 Tax=Streptomyces sp. NPDC056244 TaxID=3345762 RepID=UPI0035D71271
MNAIEDLLHLRDIWDINGDMAPAVPLAQEPCGIHGPTQRGSHPSKVEARQREFVR